MFTRTIMAGGALVALAACGAPAERAPETLPARIAGIGLQHPESVLYDSAQDQYVVSNINGDPLAKDGNGFISRIKPTGEIVALKWIDGAAPNVTLNAPKGMAVVGDTLFVADIDAVRRFDAHTGAPLGAVDIPQATFLNDVAAGPDGTVYVTDTGLKPGRNGTMDSGTDAVYRLTAHGAAAIVTGPNLGRPNGITVGPAGLTVVTMGSGSIYRIDPATGERTDLPIPDQGQLDGVVRLADGTLLISSWQAQAVYRLSPEGRFTVAVDSVTSPADIGYDTKRGILLIPLLTKDEIVLRKVG